MWNDGNALDKNWRVLRVPAREWKEGDCLAGGVCWSVDLCAGGLTDKMIAGQRHSWRDLPQPVAVLFTSRLNAQQVANEEIAAATHSVAAFGDPVTAARHDEQVKVLVGFD